MYVRNYILLKKTPNTKTLRNYNAKEEQNTTNLLSKTKKR